VKICDFGLARLRDYNTVLTANVGTIHWMAPEVLTGTQYNESADVYSVGVVIWEMFTGQCPYNNMKQVEVALSVVQNNLRPTIPPTCSTAQANIIRVRECGYYCLCCKVLVFISFCLCFASLL
jgi:serine/threonine protein kinase